VYVWELPNWPHFSWDNDRVVRTLAEARHKQGLILGRMHSLGFRLKEEAALRTLTQDVIKSSEIEGEVLDANVVRSSIARRLGMDIGALAPADRDVEGVVEMMLDATSHYDRALNKERLFSWHAALFPTGRSGLRKIRVGMWRDDTDGPMQVVSGPVGKEHVHFTAPPAERIDAEMTAFLDWFELEGATDSVLKSGVAHLWFVTIHPFDDGNGRIARAIADMALARSEHSAQRFYSMSAQIRAERKAYYDMLERTQKATLNITSWAEWYLGCLARAIDGAQQTLAGVMIKATFWEKYATVPLNARQITLLNRLFDGFEGKLTTSKWAKLAHCSQDTAYRDILDLVSRGILAKDPEGGRSTSYSLADVGAAENSKKQIIATRPLKKFREPEARILALQIAATFPKHQASTAEIKNAAPHFRQWSEDDLEPSNSRGNEHMWQEIIGNAVGSHQNSSVSIFAKGYAVKTSDGIRVTDKGIQFLKSRGLYS